MGDEVIKKVSNHMQDKVGSEGVVGRFGGEEFLTILYNNDIQQAALLADQIRSDIESKKIEFEGKQISVTVSMGIACSAETVVYQELLNKADERLYKAKENGRNQANGYLLAVPPTVNPFIFKVGCPTPTGTPCPFFPQVPIPGSIFKSFPTNSTFFKTSKPDPINVAPLIGEVILPSSIR